MTSFSLALENVITSNQRLKKIRSTAQVKDHSLIQTFYCYQNNFSHIKYHVKKKQAILSENLLFPHTLREAAGTCFESDSEDEDIK